MKNNIKKTDVVVAVQQALRENQGIGTYHIAVQPIIDRILQILEERSNSQEVLLD